LPIVVELNERFEAAVPPALSTRFVWLREAEIPEGADSVSETVPEKPLRLISVRMELPDPLTRIEAEVGLAETENSDTVTVITVEAVEVPLVALTVTE